MTQQQHSSQWKQEQATKRIHHSQRYNSPSGVIGEDTLLSVSENKSMQQDRFIKMALYGSKIFSTAVGEAFFEIKLFYFWIL